MARVGHPMIWDVCLLEWALQREKTHGTEMVAFLQKYNYLFTWGMRHPPQNRYLQNEQNNKRGVMVACSLVQYRWRCMDCYGLLALELTYSVTGMLLQRVGT